MQLLTTGGWFAVVNTTPGTTYFVQVSPSEVTTPEASPLPSAFTLSWVWNSEPANDNFANAQTISGATGSVNGSDLGATLESGEPLSTAYSVWYQYTAPATSAGTLNLNLSNVSQSQNINVFTGSSVTGLTTVRDGLNSYSPCTFATSPGVTYEIQIENEFLEPTSNFTLNCSWTASSGVTSADAVAGQTSSLPVRKTSAHSS